MLQKDTVMIEVREIISTIRSIPSDKDDSDFGNLKFDDDLGFDSLDFINFLFQIEEKYSIKIDEDLLKNDSILTVDQIVAEIVRLHD